MKNVRSISRLLKNTNVLKSGTGNNPSTALYSKTTKPEKFSDVKRTIKNVKIKKDFMLLKVMQKLIMLTF